MTRCRALEAAAFVILSLLAASRAEGDGLLGGTISVGPNGVDVDAHAGGVGAHIDVGPGGAGVGVSTPPSSSAGPSPLPSPSPAPPRENPSAVTPDEALRRGDSWVRSQVRGMSHSDRLLLALACQNILDHPAGADPAWQTLCRLALSEILRD